MSEANNSWRIDLGGAVHEVHLAHGTFSGKGEVTVDGVVVVDESTWFDTASSHTLDVAGHTAEVRIDVTHSGLAHASAPYSDGSSTAVRKHLNEADVDLGVSITARQGAMATAGRRQASS